MIQENAIPLSVDVASHLGIKGHYLDTEDHWRRALMAIHVRKALAGGCSSKGPPIIKSGSRQQEEENRGERGENAWIALHTLGAPSEPLNMDERLGHF